MSDKLSVANVLKVIKLQIADKIGRKWAIISIAVPQFIAWILVYFAQNTYYLIVSRFLQGFSGGGNY